MKNKVIGNLLYGQSGGPTSTINASAYGIFLEAFKHNEIENIYALEHGIEGIFDNKIEIIKDNDNLKDLLNTPGTYYGSTRYRLNEYKDDEKTYKTILEFFIKYNIRYFFYNGGNDSMDTIKKISEYFKHVNYECYCIGIIKTIDNDLMKTDFSLGYASAAKFIANSCIEIYEDDHSYKVGRINIVETMGRDVGWLAASSIAASLKGCAPDLILVPENPVDLHEFLNKVQEIYSKNKHCLVVVGEGSRTKDGKFLIENSTIDSFGHNQLGGVAIELCEYISKNLNIKTRYYELSLLQRANSMVASKTELKVAVNLSKFAVKAALNHKTNKCVIINRVSDTPYKCKFSLVDIKDIANQVKPLDTKYIDFKNTSINSNFINYIIPLIDGEDGLLNIYKK